MDLPRLLSFVTKVTSSVVHKNIYRNFPLVHIILKYCFNGQITNNYLLRICNFPNYSYVFTYGKILQRSSFYSQNLIELEICCTMAPLFQGFALQSLLGSTHRWIFCHKNLFFSHMWNFFEKVSPLFLGKNCQNLQI